MRCGKSRLNTVGKKVGENILQKQISRESARKHPTSVAISVEKCDTCILHHVCIALDMNLGN